MAERSDDSLNSSAIQAVQALNKGFEKLSTSFGGASTTLDANNLTTGTVPAGRMPALTGDVTMSAGTTATSIAANAVVTAKILDLNVTTAKLDNLAVTTGKINTNAVTNAKLAQMATTTIKGRVSGGTGDPEDLTATQATTILNSMVGDAGAGGTKGLAPAPAAGDAAANKFLKADGTWAQAGRILLATLTANNTSTNLDSSTSLITSDYSLYELEFNYLTPATNAITLRLILYINGSYQTANYKGSTLVSSTATAITNATAFIDLTCGARLSSTAGEGLCGTVKLFSPSTVGEYKLVTGHCSWFDDSVGTHLASQTMITGGYVGGTEAITGIRIQSSSGNLASGSVKIYGYY